MPREATPISGVSSKPTESCSRHRGSNTTIPSVGDVIHLFSTTPRTRGSSARQSSRIGWLRTIRRLPGTPTTSRTGDLATGWRPSRTGRCLVNATGAVSYTHLRAHETRHDLVCRLLLEKKKKKHNEKTIKQQITQKEQTKKLNLHKE